METFFSILLIIFIPFIWVIYKMIRYTTDAVGENSPFLRKQSIEWTAKRFFSSSETLFSGVMLLLGLITLWLTLANLPSDPLAIGLLLLSIALFFGVAIHTFWLQWKHWHQFKGRTITFDPTDLCITITQDNSHVILNSHTVSDIEYHINNRTKGPDFSYWTFILTNGSRHSISNLFFFPDVVEHYFKRLTHTVVVHESVWFEPSDSN